MEITDMDIVAALDGLGQTEDEDADQQAPEWVSLAGSSREYRLTGRPSTPLYLSCDPSTFSEYQVMVRKNIELFEAKEEDVTTNAQGRNKPIVLGQVGIRCIHCAVIPPGQRGRGAMYYPSKFDGLYQAAQNLANGHLLNGCPLIPAPMRETLYQLRDKKSASGGGKTAWAERVHALGVYEDECGLRFASRINEFASHHVHVSSDGTRRTTIFEGTGHSFTTSR